MRFPIYQVDAFADRVFAGNPAAVVPLQSWLPDAALYDIAAENNLSETAFFVPNGDDWDLRWFTPKVEVDLCGHATLATAWVIFTHLRPQAEELRFNTRSGQLRVSRDGDSLVLNFPARVPSPCAPPPHLAQMLGAAPVEVLMARDLVVVLETAAQVRALTPDLEAIAKLDVFAVMVTAPGDDGCDFVSRFFAPAKGIPEDPVTGSAHCALVPYWSKRLGKTDLLARQVSARGGELHCRLLGDRVALAGRVAPYLEGFITL